MAKRKPRRFAEDTRVPVVSSKAELDRLLAAHGASQRAIFADDDQRRALVQFRMSGRMVRLEVRVPDPKACHYPDQAERAAWRRLILIVKAKLEVIADGVSTVEREFMPDILLPDGSTLGEMLAPQLEESYRTGGMPPLLPQGKPHG